MGGRLRAANPPFAVGLIGPPDAGLPLLGGATSRTKAVSASGARARAAPADAGSTRPRRRDPLCRPYADGELGRKLSPSQLQAGDMPSGRIRGNGAHSPAPEPSGTRPRSDGECPAPKAGAGVRVPRRLAAHAQAPPVMHAIRKERSGRNPARSDSRCAFSVQCEESFGECRPRGGGGWWSKKATPGF